MKTKLFDSSTFNRIKTSKESDDYYTEIVNERNKYKIPIGGIYRQMKCIHK